MDKFDTKVKRLLDNTEITDIGMKFIWAKVIGDTDTYTLKYDRKRFKWTCPCIGKSNYRIDEDEYCTHMQAADIKRVMMGLR